MATFGYLTYCDRKISIPNKELEEKFIGVLIKKKWYSNYLWYDREFQWNVGSDIK